jgi:hypothetical protein
MAAVAAVTGVASPGVPLDVFAVAVAGGTALAALVGAGAAWTDRSGLLRAAALVAVALASAAAVTIGFVVAPAAACLVSTALVAGWNESSKTADRDGAAGRGAVAEDSEGV